MDDNLEQTRNGNWFRRTKNGTVWYGNERPSRVNLARDTSAVSPVIAVILMVAITVVLAATVFVLVSDIQSPTPAPAMSFTENRAAGNLTVTQAQPNLTWNEFTVTGCSTMPTGTVEAGDTITGCTGQVSIRHNPSNSLVYQGQF